METVFKFCYDRGQIPGTLTSLFGSMFTLTFDVTRPLSSACCLQADSTDVCCSRLADELIIRIKFPCKLDLTFQERRKAVLSSVYAMATSKNLRGPRTPSLLVRPSANKRSPFLSTFCPRSGATAVRTSPRTDSAQIFPSLRFYASSPRSSNASTASFGTLDTQTPFPRPPKPRCCRGMAESEMK